MSTLCKKMFTLDGVNSDDYLFGSSTTLLSKDFLYTILTKPWWLSGLACELIANSMFKVKGLNPDTSILKLVFSNFQSVCF